MTKSETTPKSNGSGKNKSTNVLYDVMHGSGKAFNAILQRIQAAKGGKK